MPEHNKNGPRQKGGHFWTSPGRYTLSREGLMKPS